ncbi:MAG: LicD family protein [Ruminococcus sp.]|nr:LicD family protein [Candidatus Copronaster equi]
MSCTIEELQQVEYEMLSIFDEYCKKHSIKYVLGYGTLLGAIGHNGFIPWDDDIDLIMDNIDFKKLMKAIKKDPIDGIFFQWYKTDKEYPFHFAKLRKNKTLMSEWKHRELHIHHGVYIDLFIYVSKPKTNIGIKLQEFVLGFFQLSLEKDLNLMKLSQGKEVDFSSGITKLILKTPSPILNMLRNIIFFFLCFFNDTSSENVREYNYFGDYNICEKRSFFEPQISHKFGEKEFPVPENYDDLLRFIYGDDYMTPIKTHNHIDLSVVELEYDGNYGK